MLFHLKIFAVLLISMSSLFACSKNDTKIQLSQDSVVLAFGDSLTYGTGTSRENSYPSALKNTLGLEVINEGIPGEISEKGLLRLEKILQSSSPDLVILCHGGNDILKKLSLSLLESNLAQMIELSQSYGAEVILVGVPKPSIMLSPLSLYESLANKYNLVSDLDSLSDLLQQPSMKSDSVHLNKKGYRELANNIAKKIEVL